MLQGRWACSKALATVLHTTTKRIARIHSLYQSGVTTMDKVTPQGRRTSERYHSVRVSVSESTPTVLIYRTEQAMTWMDGWFRLVGDQMPDSQMIHLPQFLTREGVYKEMEQEMRMEGMTKQEIVSLSHFYLLWSKQFPRVSIPKVCSYHTLQLDYMSKYKRTHTDESLCPM